MTEQPQAQPQDDRRKAERRPVSLPGHIVHDGGEVDCQVFDISPEGALLSAPEGVGVNRSIRLKVTRNGEFLGIVVWIRDGRMGVKFMQFEEDGIRVPHGAEAALRKVS